MKNSDTSISTHTSSAPTFYITTTLPYVNAEPHLGHAMEFIRADIIARYKKSQGFEVFFNTGTDEHGQKLFDAAKKEGKEIRAYVDEHAVHFQRLQKALGLSEDVHFLRTTEPRHEAAAQAFWNICFKNGFIYKKNYKTKYCVGCELEKQDSELVDGRCPIHPTYEIQLRDEENYFFKFSHFAELLLDLYAKKADFVVPDFRFNEIKAFVERGLDDFSISRLKSKMSWGVSVPNDPEQVMYVWFDALVSYISTLGWPHMASESVSLFDRFWKNGTPVQYCGKDNLRQQSAIWQAMLMAAGLPPTSQIVINGFITGEGGIKMSKSLGNTVSPFDIVEEYSADALRYYVARELSSFEDSPFTADKFRESYNAGLANGLGNLVSRVVKMAQNSQVTLNVDFSAEALAAESRALIALSSSHYDHFEINKVAEAIWQKIQGADKYIQDNQPFKTVKTDLVAGKAQINYLLGEVFAIGLMLGPIMPDTSAKIIQAVKDTSIAAPLFLRKEEKKV